MKEKLEATIYVCVVDDEWGWIENKVRSTIDEKTRFVGE